MAMSEYYVDPSIAADSGAGTIGDPYGDLQYALDNITRDITDGDRINIKAGTEEVFTAAIDYSTYGTPAIAAPLIYQGYSSAAGDGGIAEIDLGANNMGQSAVSLADLKVRNVGSGGFSISNATATNVWFSDSTGNGIVLTEGSLYGCVASDMTGAQAVFATGNSHMIGCYFEFSSGESPTTRCIYPTGASVTSQNCFKVATGITVIDHQDDSHVSDHNSILQTGAKAGVGINFRDTKSGQRCTGNIVEGFATGYDWGNQAEPTGAVHENAAYNNTTNYDSTFIGPYYRDNETLSSSAFAKSGTITLSDFVSNNAGFWADVAAYFEPQDTGNVFGNFGFHALTKGAVPRPVGAGGGGLLRVNMNGNVFG
jgi:hypothetical protein